MENIATEITQANHDISNTIQDLNNLALNWIFILQELSLLNVEKNIQFEMGMWHGVTSWYQLPYLPCVLYSNSTNPKFAFTFF